MSLERGGVEKWYKHNPFSPKQNTEKLLQNENKLYNCKNLISY